MKPFIMIAAALINCFIINSAIAENLPANSVNCHGHMINPITDIDWNGLYPITIGSSEVVSGDLPDTENPDNPFCECQSGIYPIYGLAIGYWEPMALIDVTRTPYCLVNLGGQQIQTDATAEGDVDTQSPDQHSSFYYVHYYNFPVMNLIGGELLGGSCHADGSFLIPSYFSELDPTWHDEQLAAIAFPETQWFENPITALGAQGACAVDSVAANTGLPSDAAFWCAGSQGFMYPMTGEVAEYVSGIQASTLLSERVVFKLHQLGFIQDTSRNNLCSEHWDYNLRKSRYRYQLIYPQKGNVEPFGRTTSIWGMNKEMPWNGDDAGYLIFRKRNCCNL